MKFTESIVFLHEWSENGNERTFFISFNVCSEDGMNSWVKLKKPKDCLKFEKTHINQKFSPWLKVDLWFGESNRDLPASDSGEMKNQKIIKFRQS